VRTTLMADGARPRSETISGTDLFAITDGVAERIRTWITGRTGEPVSEELVGYPEDPRERELFAAAMHEQFRGNARAALRFLELLLAENPGQRAARYEQAIAFRRIGELARSQSLAEALLADAVATADLPVEAKVHNLLGILLWIDGDLGEAATHFERSLELHRRLEDQRAQVSNLINIGILASERDDLAQAAQRYAEALSLIDRVGNLPSLEASAYNSLGVLAWMRGDVVESGRMHERALALRRQISDRAGESASLNNLGTVARALGEAGEAEEWFQQSLAMRRDLGDRRGAISTLENLAALRFRRGRFAETDSLLIEALALEQELGVDMVRPRILSTMALVAKARGQWSAARELSDQVLELLRAREQPEATFAALATRADLLVAMGELAEAGDLLAEMDRAVPGSPQSRSHALLELSRAGLQDARGSTAEAAGSLRRALDHAREAGDTELESDTIVRLSECLLELGELAEARLRLASLPGNWEEWWRLHWVRARLAFAEGDATAALQAAQRSQELAGEHWREEQETLLRTVADAVEGGAADAQPPSAPAPAG
jgi:tetratricopeptide (TPR) repeat protein